MAQPHVLAVSPCALPLSQVGATCCEVGRILAAALTVSVYRRLPCRHSRRAKAQSQIRCATLCGSSSMAGSQNRKQGHGLRDATAVAALAQDRQDGAHERARRRQTDWCLGGRLSPRPRYLERRWTILSGRPLVWTHP